MRVLKLGCKGNDVESWQNFLRGYFKDSTLKVDGDFGEKTKVETKRFQTKVGFVGCDVDGKVGRQTYGKAMLLGFASDIEDDREDFGPNWPPRSSNLPYMWSAQREKVFGKFSYVPNPTKYNAEGIKITDNWVKDNIIKIYVPQLVGVKGAPKSGEIFFHKKISNQLINTFQEWENAGHKDKILTWGGSWVPRFIRGSRTTLSNHSWGTAFDINVPWNGLGRVPALKGKKGSVRELVEIANDCGFDWGGHWSRRPDGMHFQIAKVL